MLLSSHALADDDSDVHIIPYGFISAEQAVEIAKFFLSPRGKVSANTRNNTLIVVDSPSIAQKIEEQLRDIPPPQNVRIEVQVLEGQEVSHQIAGLPIGGGSMAENRNMQLTVLDGSHASISVGEKVPYPAFFYEFFMNHGYIVRGTVFEDVGSKMDAQVRLYGDQAKILVTPVITYRSGREKKTIAVRELSTEVLAGNGQTVEIGASPGTDEFFSWFYRSRSSRSLRFLLKPTW